MSEGKSRDFGNWDRKGPLTPTLPPAGPQRSASDRPMSRDGPMMRRNSPSWGEGKSQEGSRPPRREFTERPVPERAPTAAEMDTQWRTKMKPDAPPPPPAPVARSPAQSTKELSAPPSPAAPAAPATRPKLNLAKRTVSEAVPETSVATATDSKASPFGAARPVDTAAKEREIEEKQHIAMKEKKEADDKAKAEKKAAEEKAKEERQATKEDIQKKTQSVPIREKPNGPKPNNADKGNGAAAAPSGKQYEILRRGAGDGASVASEEPEAESQNGLPVEDKEVKPKEIIRDIGTTNGETAQNPPESTANELEEEGWSTVPSKGKRKNGTSGRALAS